MRFAIAGNPHLPDLEGILDRVERKAAELGIPLVFEASLSANGRRESASLEEFDRDIDLVLTLGGDGTLLHTARVAAPRGIPVLGCNLGRLGFLARVSLDGIEAAMSNVANGDYEIEERLALRVESRVMGPGGPEPLSAYAINDAVIHKGRFERLVSFRVLADDQLVGQYSADGVIMATATGSTAYSLSAGGPIVSPSVDGIVVTPIAAHTLALRPAVFPGDTRLSVEPVSADTDLQLTVDGQQGCAIEAGACVRTARSRHPVRLVRLPGDSFFAALRKKLRWGDVRVRERPDAAPATDGPPGAEPTESAGSEPAPDAHG